MIALYAFQVDRYSSIGQHQVGVEFPILEFVPTAFFPPPAKLAHDRLKSTIGAPSCLWQGLNTGMWLVGLRDGVKGALIARAVRNGTCFLDFRVATTPRANGASCL